MTMRMRAPLDIEADAKQQACPVCGAVGHCDPDWFPPEHKSRQEAMRAGVDLRRVLVLNGVRLTGFTHMRRLRGKMVEAADGHQG